MSAPSAPAPASQPANRPDKGPDHLMIYMWPKTPVLYPMALLALLCWVISSFAGGMHHLMGPIKDASLQQRDAVHAAVTPGTPAAAAVAAQGEASQGVGTKSARELVGRYHVDRILGLIFMLGLATSLLCLCIDIEVRWALILFAAGLAVVLGAALVNTKVLIFPALANFLALLDPIANAQFYMCVFLIWVALMIVSLLVVRFHYVKVESNEVLVVGGLLENQRRFSTLQMRYVKEITDVMEYYLPFVKSGRIIFSFSGTDEPVVVDNVRHIDKVMTQLDKLVGELKVQERPT